MFDDRFEAVEGRNLEDLEGLTNLGEVVFLLVGLHEGFVVLAVGIKAKWLWIWVLLVWIRAVGFWIQRFKFRICGRRISRWRRTFEFFHKVSSVGNFWNLRCIWKHRIPVEGQDKKFTDRKRRKSRYGYGKRVQGCFQTETSKVTISDFNDTVGKVREYYEIRSWVLETYRCYEGIWRGFGYKILRRYSNSRFVYELLFYAGFGAPCAGNRSKGWFCDVLWLENYIVRVAWKRWERRGSRFLIQGVWWRGGSMSSHILVICKLQTWLGGGWRSYSNFCYGLYSPRFYRLVVVEFSHEGNIGYRNEVLGFVVVFGHMDSNGDDLVIWCYHKLGKSRIYRNRFKWGCQWVLNPKGCYSNMQSKVVNLVSDKMFNYMFRIAYFTSIRSRVGHLNWVQLQGLTRKYKGRFICYGCWFGYDLLESNTFHWLKWEDSGRLSNKKRNKRHVAELEHEYNRLYIMVQIYGLSIGRTTSDILWYMRLWWISRHRRYKWDHFGINANNKSLINNCLIQSQIEVSGIRDHVLGISRGFFGFTNFNGRTKRLTWGRREINYFLKKKNIKPGYSRYKSRLGVFTFQCCIGFVEENMVRCYIIKCLFVEDQINYGFTQDLFLFPKIQMVKYEKEEYWSERHRGLIKFGSRHDFYGFLFYRQVKMITPLEGKIVTVNDEMGLVLVWDNGITSTGDEGYNCYSHDFGNSGQHRIRLVLWFRGYTMLIFFYENWGYLRGNKIERKKSECIAYFINLCIIFTCVLWWNNWLYSEAWEGTQERKFIWHGNMVVSDCFNLRNSRKFEETTPSYLNYGRIIRYKEMVECGCLAVNNTKTKGLNHGLSENLELW